ncbi:DinB family protein [Marinomonas balearica]|uniref:Putative damage-inducible protein DinB n=1 Tax=Marinomonas balearica TaxID=491947 RepID=A0A4R6M982_9GAMM|nr:DinB family protein [Marinomonas balearica]TDO98058.1 putative damage-inducible protein DinB [Marinomonas balearica]
MSLNSGNELMASYNQYMNRSVYESAAKLTSEQLNKDQGAFFNSILGTLNHILVGDIIWLKRFADHSMHFPSLDYLLDVPSPKALNSILYSDFEELMAARFKLDEVIVNFTSELTAESLESPLKFHNMKGVLFSKKLGYLIQHFFNHQTHHRGQVSTLLYQAGIDIGVTDLLVKIPNIEVDNDA